MERTPLKSTSLKSAAYDAAKQQLEVEFTAGTVYRYRDVPASVYSGLLEAKSPGQFFAASIRGQFRSEKVEPKSDNQTEGE